MQKIILYYKFTPLADPEMVRLWQRALCEKLNLKGRILIAPHGINGTVGGELDGLKAYVKEFKQFAGFKDTTFKWSDGSRDHFPKLQVRVRPELVAFGAADELKVDRTGVVGGGKHLKPAEVHELVNTYGDDVVFFDGRNAYEAAVGRFKNAVVPNTTTSHDFVRELDSGSYDHLKAKKVVTYCTGGIRCEVLSSLMKNRGFEDVYQMDGGIVKYGEQYGDDGLWEGSLYVFDDRMGMEFSDHARIIGTCIHCGGPTSNYENCALKTCNKLVLICEACKQDPAKSFHTTACARAAQKEVAHA
ncbi:MAG TPA: rhodanese-related sulfurtransferase [Candidatus Saccharimonadales bacterium]|nr:rhodanese-related sulfurtransferase [Candidatus Saccharimonadales bacterium]